MFTRCTRNRESSYRRKCWRGAPTAILTNASRLVVSDFYLTNALSHAYLVHSQAASLRNSQATRAMSRELAMSITLVYGDDSVKASRSCRAAPMPPACPQP